MEIMTTFPNVQASGMSDTSNGIVCQRIVVMTHFSGITRRALVITGTMVRQAGTSRTPNAVEWISTTAMAQTFTVQQ